MDFLQTFWKLGILGNVICSIIFLTLIVLSEDHQNYLIQHITVAFLFIWLILYLPFNLIIFLQIKTQSTFQKTLKTLSVAGIICGILIGVFWLIMAVICIDGCK